MQAQWLPEQRYALPLLEPVRGNQDRHATLAGRLIGYGTPDLQCWMTAPDLATRPQWSVAIDQFARDVVEQQHAALRDGQTWQQHLARLWRSQPREQVPLALTVDEQAVFSGRLEQLLATTGICAVKVKVSATTPLRDLLAALAPLTPRCEVRLDANQCWRSLDSAQLQDVLLDCRRAGIASVEDPTTPERWPATSPVPLAADLIDSDLATWQALLHSGRAQLAIVKPSLFGSLAVLGQVLHELARRGIPAAFSSLFDAPLGLAQLAALAACAPGRLVASGLATHLELDPRWNPPQPDQLHGSWPSSAPLAPCLPDLCAQAALRQPHAVALRWLDADGSPQQTWQQLDVAVDSAALWLCDRGIKPGDVVATWCDNHRDLVVLAWAIWRVGACWLPLHPRWTLAEALGTVRRVQPALLVADIGHMPQLSDVTVLLLPSLLPPGTPPRTWLDPQAPALLVATSGTTGAARLVVHTLQTLHAAAASHWARWPKDSCNWLMCLPLSHVSGVSILLRAAAIAGSLSLTARGDAPAIYALAGASEATHLSVVPLQLARLIELGPPPSSLSWVLVGGASLDPQLLERAQQARWPAVPSWGMSETVGQAATGDVGEPSVDQQGLRRVGAPLPGVWLRIAEPAGPQALGEIEVAALQRMQGYLGESQPLGLFWPTGDLGALGPDGALWVASRRADRIIVAGENVDPLEVEAALLQVPGVADAAVVGVAAGPHGEAVAAHIQVKPGVAGDLQVALAQLAPFKRPRLWLLTEAPLPRNALGKLLRGEVRLQLEHGGTAQPHWPTASEPVTK